MAFKFQKIDVIDIEQDPVRPELSLAFRSSKTRGREIYALVDDKGGYASVVCIAHCKFVPKSVDELRSFLILQEVLLLHIQSGVIQKEQARQ